MKNILTKSFAFLLFITCLIVISPGRVFADSACGALTCPNGDPVEVNRWGCAAKDYNLDGVFDACIESPKTTFFATCVLDGIYCTAGNRTSYPSGCTDWSPDSDGNCHLSTATRIVACCPKPPPSPYCGDGTCNNSETNCDCPEDCTGECNSPPTCTITGPTSGIIGQPTSLLTGSGADSDGTVSSYAWTAGEGTFSTPTVSTTTWTPSTVGTKTITLTVTDDKGATGTCTRAITVTCNTYTLNITVKEAMAPAFSCPPSGGAQGDVTVGLMNTLSPHETFSITTPSSGVVSIPNIPLTAKSFSVNASKTTAGPNPYTYSLKCPTTITVTPPPTACSTRTADPLGIGKNSKVAWSVVLDGDVYGSSISSTNIPAYVLLGGFKNYLINHLSSIGGIALSPGSISSSRIYDSTFGASASYVSGGDVALSKFSFAPPSEATSITPSGSSFTFPSGKAVFKTTAASFNSWLSGGNRAYTISSPNTITILYLTGSGDLKFTKGLIANDKNRQLIIITNSKVEIQDTVGFPGNFTATYIPSAYPNIEAAIISSGNIVFKSKGTNPGTDIPVMVTGPLVSRSVVQLNRDLGQDIALGNGLYPAQAVKYYPKFLYGITSLEYLNKDIPNYTGLRSFDVQFVYDDWNTY